MEKLVLSLNVRPQKCTANQQSMHPKEANYIPVDIRKSIERAASTTHSTPVKSSAIATDIPFESSSKELDSRGNIQEIYTIIITEAEKPRNFGLSMRFFGALKSFFQHSGNR